MGRNTCHTLDLSDPSVLASIDFAAIERKASVIHMAGGRCEACNKVLEDTESAIKGYASGHELGLCRKCASYVNTEEAINAAEKAGHKVHSKIIFAPSGGYAPPAGQEDYDA